ncbi:methyl-accepting chemotaxis sensory transducer [Tistlia consotensis]|uniref:Methyl-accepting chemotaxis sensory transducer n=1 Tax=Tistlia consotensis USBA 355 TaxID=560819 RepID=A0A1Y6BKZ0_9PROT|nr:methyl-accepting chemotaxis protein [Tistlia consotensis]SMF14516.1 methyl-accepting chemotaxis sensory transducer [Tistlia consotensis USBA 355]SNR49482.1 methyl-accepting chemotaxis sensory transducer [Tistlia consotensis]
MGRFRLTIRTSLLLVTGLLSAGVVALAGISSLTAWQQMQQSARVVASNRTADLLLTGAGSWAVERGVTNAALSAPEAIDGVTRKAIDERRRAADSAMASALQEIESGPEFQGRDALVSALRADHSALDALRKQADEALAQPRQARPAATAASWAPGITKVIMASQRLRLAAQYLPRNAQTSILLAQDVKHAVWTMSEYAGRERAIVGGLVSSGTAMTPQTLQTLAGLRGRVEQAWSGIEAYLEKAEAAPEIRAQADAVRTAFFDKFEAVRKQVYAAGEAGKPYPIDAHDWIADATAGIDSLLALAKLAGTVSATLAAQSRSLGTTQMAVNATLLVMAGGLALLAFWIVIWRVVRPINRLTGGMQELAEGNLEVELPDGSRGDEVALMSQAVEVFRQNALDVRRLEAEQKAGAERAEADKRRAMNELAETFEASVKGVVEAVAQAAAEMEATAGNLSTTADQTNGQVTTVASAATQASGNVQTVASASEELAASISEIGRQAGESRTIATTAVDKAEATNRQIEGLVEAAQKIGDVISLIQDIAGQTNLLALNATIEAARAGDAGKGFAVVASEVKVLANQVAQATSDISIQVHGIQSATGEAAGSIKEIAHTIAEINENAASIASAVEQQNAATNEIARNVQEASAGTAEVSRNAEGLKAAAQETGAAASQMLQASGGLSRNAQQLGREVEAFIGKIRAA